MYALSKDYQTDLRNVLDITNQLQGQAIVTAVLADVSPTNGLDVVLNSHTATGLDLSYANGEMNVSYGVNVLVTTAVSQLRITIAVRCVDPQLNPYTSFSYEPMTTLVDTIQAGMSSVGAAIFPLPASIDPMGGYVNYELMDPDGVVYSSGNSFEYVVKPSASGSTIIARCGINVPSNVPLLPQGQKFVIRYTLVCGDYQTQSFEYVTIIGLTTVPLGTASSVELVGDTAELSIVTADQWQQMDLELYSGNTKIAQQRIAEFQRVGSGYYWAGRFDTSQLPVSIVPYTVIWKYRNPQGVPYTETAQLWIINPSIATAYQDVLAKINKARTTLYGTADTLFPIETIMTWLRRGMDGFNGAYGHFTRFTMTNALGPIREFWLMYAEVAAIESQYMAEGEKAFNFSGAAISLDVDKTQYLDAAMSRIQARLDAEVPNLKSNLIKRGNMGGDGSADPTQLQAGSTAGVGITITPLNAWGGRMLGRRLM